MTFKKLNINHTLIENLNRKKIQTPTEIQEKVIPLILNGKNIVAKSKTGSGKTIAFAIPIIQRIINEKKRGMIIAPTRDLANQIFENVKELTKGTNIKSEIFFGGVGYDRQIKMLSKGVDIIIGTPGRILDLSKNKFMKMQDINFLVIDEADEMLDMGFINDLKKIIKLLTNREQTMLFSATIPENVKKLINSIITNYEEISIKNDWDKNNYIEQIAYLVHETRKFDLLIDILKKNQGQSIIFSRKKDEVKKIAYKLIKNKFSVEALHSDRKQSSRMNALKRFRNYEVDILVATNVAARGIDIKDLPLVINYNLPDDKESYVHRIGRTGRAGSYGRAISFINKNDLEKIKVLENITNSKIKVIKDEKLIQKKDENKNKQKENKFIVNNIKKIDSFSKRNKNKKKSLVLKKNKK